MQVKGAVLRPGLMDASFPFLFQLHCSVLYLRGGCALPWASIKSLFIPAILVEASASDSHSISSFHYKQAMLTPLTLAMAVLASFALANPLTTHPSYLSPYPTPCSSTMCVDNINSCGQTYGGCYPACSGYPPPTFTDPGCDPPSSPVSPTYPDPRCSVTVTITVTVPSPYYPSGCSTSSTTTTYSSPAGPTGYEA